MRVIDPGHTYRVTSFDVPRGAPDEQVIRFVKRTGEKYPGNEWMQSGTITQELLRVLIHRTKVLDQQEHWPGNQGLINEWRLQLYRLEVRAAHRHGRTLKRRHLDRDNLGNPAGIELDPACWQCGHIECGGTCRANST